MLQTSHIRVRDPFVLACKRTSKYYLYITNDPMCNGSPAIGFDVYISEDLAAWEGPFSVFRAPHDFWADRDFWAPEVHLYNEKFYMFASFKGPTTCRGTQILVSDSPMGPFLPLVDRPVTPSEWECLDGTLHVDGDDCPWIIFCHEWAQVSDGEICTMKLDRDFKTTCSEPILLFKASWAKWVKSYPPENSYGHAQPFVTDGPFLYRKKDGQLLMFWSSFGERGYALGIARSQSGSVIGPWKHDQEPLFADDGGHGMLFETFDGQLMLALHRPNISPNERAVFIPLNLRNL